MEDYQWHYPNVPGFGVGRENHPFHSRLEDGPAQAYADDGPMGVKTVSGVNRFLPKDNFSYTEDNALPGVRNHAVGDSWHHWNGGGHVVSDGPLGNYGLYQDVPMHGAPGGNPNRVFMPMKMDIPTGGIDNRSQTEGFHVSHTPPHITPNNSHANLADDSGTMGNDNPRNIAGSKHTPMVDNGMEGDMEDETDGVDPAVAKLVDDVIGSIAAKYASAEKTIRASEATSAQGGDGGYNIGGEVVPQLMEHGFSTPVRSGKKDAAESSGSTQTAFGMGTPLSDSKHKVNVANEKVKALTEQLNQAKKAARAASIKTKSQKEAEVKFLKDKLERAKREMNALKKAADVEEKAAARSAGKRLSKIPVRYTP